jgi:acyl-coenzyme A thioesterase PaaI-like protein
MNLAKLFLKFNAIPLFGKRLFSLVVALKAPYFLSICPRIDKLEVGLCEIRLKKRWAVTNHIGTVHAIAMCNLCELTAGLAMEATLHSTRRWIPKEMKVSYLKKATTHLRARVEIKKDSLVLGDNWIPVPVYDLTNEKVMEASINMYVSQRHS